MARRRPPRPCPCGTGRTYQECCRPAHQGYAPSTAEALMRSRYSAYALADNGYLLRSWHPSTRPAQIDSGSGLRWTGLSVTGTEAGGLFDSEGFVEFVAHYREPAGDGEMRERSRFLRADGAWLYWGPA